MSNIKKAKIEIPSKSNATEKPLEKIRRSLISIRDSINWQLVVSTLSLVAAITIGYLSLSRQVSTVREKVDTVDNRVENVEQSVLAERFAISMPNEGSSVDVTGIIRGTTPFSERNHYLIVTPIKTGDDFVQDHVTPDITGSWTVLARFGTGEVGIGEKFLVRVLATRSTVPSEILRAVPPDAVFSRSIIVKREK